MAPTDENKPQRDEILNQLECLLASKRFKNAVNHADFLRFVVTLTLAGKKTTQAVIGKALFPKFKKKRSSDVRVTAMGLRRSLRAYYAYEGRRDPVIISLPKPQPGRKTAYLAGEQYRPRFRYSPLTKANTMFRLGQNHLARKTPLGISYAIAHFVEVIELDAHHIPARLLLAETLCLYAWMGYSDSKELFCAAAGLAAKATALSPKSWRAYAILGTASLFLRNRAYAHLAFKRALALDRIETERYPWYHLCLLALGKTEKALSLASALADESAHDAYVLACHGLLLYASRRFDEAWTQARSAIDIDFHCWIAYLVFALVELACGERSKAFSYMESATPGSNKDDYAFPGLAALCHEPKADADAEENFMNLVWFRIKERKSSPTQSAFAFMAQGKNKDSLQALNLACTRCDPAILFAEFLPVFDPLRKYKQFKALVRRRIKSKSTPCPDLIAAPVPGRPFLFYASSTIPRRPISSSAGPSQE